MGPVASSTSRGVSLLTLGYKRLQLLPWALSYSFAHILPVFLSLSLSQSLSDHYFAGSQLPCHENTQAAYETKPMG